MGVTNLFTTATRDASPLDGSASDSQGTRQVSDFLTVQSFTNFAAMTGAIGAAWKALQIVWPPAETLWVPYVFALAFAAISLLMSLAGLRKSDGKYDRGALAGAVFVGVINALVLAGAVVGTSRATSPNTAQSTLATP